MSILVLIYDNLDQLMLNAIVHLLIVHLTGMGRKFPDKIFVHFSPVRQYFRKIKSYELEPEFDALSNHDLRNYLSDCVRE
jgi:hypothetical protein